MIRRQHHVVFGFAKCDIFRLQFETENVAPGVRGRAGQPLQAGNPVFRKKPSDVLAVTAALGNKPVI